MTADEAEDWLTVALGEVRNYSLRTLDKACLEARRTCTHHSHIVPTIVAAADKLIDREAELDRWTIPPARQLPAPEAPMVEVASMTEQLLRIGLECGALTQGEDGTITWADAA